MKKLPVGIQSFSELREGGYLYVDKTEHIHELVAGGKYYFLSRPRRFGKSLLVSTMQELFSGNRKLFEGLWIENEWDWGKTNPILHIPFSSLGYKELGLEQALHRHLDKVIEDKGFDVEEESLSQKFEELLKIFSETDGQVVLLIDEYDKPIIDFLGEEVEQAKINQQVLKNFYSVIKDSDPYLRLVFITGVSKFSRVSIFSDLNNLYDITMSENYSSMLGYTQEELENYFEAHLNFFCQKKNYSREEALEEIQRWYNGYSWDGEVFVYNPFSILLFFQDRRFMNFWFKTATPTFLLKLIRQEAYYDFDGIKVGETAFDSFDLEHLNIEALLFQTGYLTIKEYDAKRRLYTLGYPNQEVKESMLEYLIDAFSNVPHTQVRAYALDVADALEEENMEKVKEVFNILFRSLPYQLHQKTERFYHAVIHLFFKYIGLDVQSEVSTARGSADSIVVFGDKVYCFEFKLDRSAGEALEQIKKKGYVDAYLHTGKKIILVGVNFSSEKREIDEWKVEYFNSTV